MTKVLRPSLKTVRARLLPESGPHHDQEIPSPLYEKSPSDHADYSVAMSKPEAYPFELSAQMQDVLSTRAEIAQKLHTTRPGVTGQIVCVETLMHTHLRSGHAVLPSPIFILLNAPRYEPSEIESPELYKLASGVWQGWMICPDSDYMNEWDVLLNDDALRESSCKFVQTWNSVEVHLGTVHRVAGLVGSTLLQNVRYLSEQFVRDQNESTIPKLSEPGKVVQRQLPFGWVCTGSLQNESNAADPRNSYVQMYGQYATLFSSAVWSMLRDAELETAPQIVKKNISILDRVRNLLPGLVSARESGLNLVRASGIQKSLQLELTDGDTLEVLWDDDSIMLIPHRPSWNTSTMWLSVIEFSASSDDLRIVECFSFARHTERYVLGSHTSELVFTVTEQPVSNLK